MLSWRVPWLCDVTDACGGYIDGTNGTITSPFYPSIYPPNKNCVWLIVAPPQHRITITFSHFDVEGNNVSVEKLVICCLLFLSSLSVALDLRLLYPAQLSLAFLSGVSESSNSFGWGKGGKVTAGGTRICNSAGLSMNRYPNHISEI